MNRWCDFPKGANPRVTMEGGNRHPAMRRGYQGTTEKAGLGPGWGGGSASSSSPPHNSPNTSSFLCLLFRTKDLKRVVPTQVFPMSSLSIHFSPSTRTHLAILATKMALGSPSVISIVSRHFSSIAALHILLHQRGLTTPCFLKHSPLISFWFYVFSFLTVVAPLFASPFYLTSGSLILKLGTIDIGVR